MSVPELRFPEFEGEWEEKKLGDIVKFLDGKRIPLKDSDRKKRSGPYPYYGASGIIDFIDDYIFDEELILLGEDGANIINRSSRLVFLAKGKYWVNNHAHVLKALFGNDQYFLSEQLERVNYAKYNTGTAQPKLNQEVCKKIPLKMPEILEQEKIASFLSTLDEKIEKLEKKQVLWEAYKKGMMQKIFSQELRFKDENGEEYPDWFYLNFNEIFKSISTRKYQIKSSEISQNGNFIVIDQGKNLIAGFSDDSSKVFADIPVIVYGDHTTIVKYAENKFIIGADGTKLLKSKINSSLKYLYYSLDFFNVQAEGYKRHFSILKNSNLPIPSIQEQKKIYDFLSNIDIKLEKIKKELQINQYYKKGLLQKLFC